MSEELINVGLSIQTKMRDVMEQFKQGRMPISDFDKEIRQLIANMIDFELQVGLRVRENSTKNEGE